MTEQNNDRQDRSVQEGNGRAIFTASALISIIFAIWGILSHESFANAASNLMQLLIDHFCILYLGAALFFVLFGLFMAFSPFGKIRLGREGEEPEYSLFSWFAMLFAAGMGIGLVFWGIAEPLSHYVAPMKGVPPMSEESAAFSIRSCFMHWGLHPWACYSIMALSLAYVMFVKREKVLVSNLFKPMLGDRHKKGLVSDAVDIYTVFLTVIGVSASFGMGCLQICAGLEYLFGIPSNVYTWVILITLITALFIASAVSGLQKGMKLLSNANMIIAVLLMIAAFIIGPSGQIVRDFGIGIRDYIINFIPDSIRTSAEGDRSWIQNWRVYYWAWWISWTPFVGIFIARISKGRTIRQFILGVILVPTLVSTIWFSIFGGFSINVAGLFTPEELSAIVAAPETALFHIFAQYKGSMILSITALILLTIFFVTSANSATFVLSMLTSGGEENPPNGKKIFWGILVAVTSIALVLTGNISMIQTAGIVASFPYIIILLLLCLNIILAIKSDIRKGTVGKSAEVNTEE